MFFFNNIAPKKFVFWYVRVCQNTHSLYWWPYICQQFHSTDECCFCLTYLKMSLEIAIYFKFRYTFSFFSHLFTLPLTDGSVITCSAILWYLLTTALSLFLSKIVFTSSFLELVKIFGLCLSQKVLIQLICLIVTCTLLRLKIQDAIFFQINFFGLTHHIYRTFNAFVIFFPPSSV